MTWNRCFEDRFIPGVQWVVEDSTVLLRNSKVSTNIVVLSHGDSRDVLPKCPSASAHAEEPAPTTKDGISKIMNACAMGPRLYNGRIRMSTFG